MATLNPLKSHLRLGVLLWVLIGHKPLVAQIIVTDDLGQAVSLSQPARRVISLSPHLTELLFAIGAEKTLVGAVEASDYPPAANKIRRIGNASALDFETIVALQPDLIVAWHSGNGSRALAKLQQLGLALYRSEPTQLADIAKNLDDLGQLTGFASNARQKSALFRQQLDQLTQPACSTPVTVFYQLWNQPLMTLNRQSLITQAITHCGGDNIFAAVPEMAAKIDIEAVLAANPEIIIVSDPQWIEPWQQWPQLKASQHQHIYYIPPDYLHRPTERILMGMAQLCAHVDRIRTQSCAKTNIPGSPEVGFSVK